jgi:hypothetical protein
MHRSISILFGLGTNHILGLGTFLATDNYSSNKYFIKASFFDLILEYIFDLLHFTW